MSIVRRKAFGLLLFNGLLQNTTQPRCVAVGVSRCAGGRPCYPGYNTVRRGLYDHANHLNALQRNRSKAVNAIFRLCRVKTIKTTEDNLQIIAERAGMTMGKLRLLDKWMWDRCRNSCFAKDTAQMLGYQEADGGNMSNMPSYLALTEYRMLENLERINVDGLSNPVSLTQIGRLPTEALRTAVCLMGEDRLIRAFGFFQQAADTDAETNGRLYVRQFVQAASFAGWYFEVAAHMGSAEAAQYLIRIVNHPALKNFWKESEIDGPTLELPRKVIEAEVLKSPPTCNWSDFSAYMDLFYSAEDLQKTYNRSNHDYLLSGIDNMLYRIRRNSFEQIESKIHQPRVYPPHKHLLRIIEHCLQSRGLALEKFPRPKLLELRETMLQELADKYDDREANFRLAIKNGDWTSPDFHQYLTKAHPPLLDDHHHGDDLYSSATHAVWLSLLRQLQQEGMLIADPASPPPAVEPSKVSSLNIFATDTQEQSMVLNDAMIGALRLEASVAESMSSEPFFYNRVLAFVAIAHRYYDGPDVAALLLALIISSVKEANPSLEKQRRLKQQLDWLTRIQHEDFEAPAADDEPIRGWSDEKIDDILQKFANPNVLIRKLQKQMMK